jgi:2-iminobutanoate/2-iminopropanoate deaminase
MQKRIINTDKAPAPIGPYNQAVWAGNILFISGQVALVPETGDMITSDIDSETHQVMNNLQQILKEAGLGFQDVVKTSIFLSDMDLFGRVNNVYARYFADAGETAEPAYPARETVAVKGLPRNARVEISLIAVKE